MVLSEYRAAKNWCLSIIFQICWGPFFGGVLNNIKHVQTSSCLLYISEWRKKILTTRNGHGQSGWSPISCEGLYFHAMCENRVSVSGWSPNIGCEGFHTKLNIPSPLPTTLVFRKFCRLVISYYIYIYPHVISNKLPFLMLRQAFVVATPTNDRNFIHL